MTTKLERELMDKYQKLKNLLKALLLFGVISIGLIGYFIGVLVGLKSGSC